MRTYIFGPVPSRRLGISLGVDLTPTKTCTYDCLYCQLSHTTRHTSRRDRFCDIKSVFKELKEVLKEIDKPDWITFSGTGEPTLHLDLGGILAEIKKLKNAPTCVITNSSLMHLKEVRNELFLADRILPTVSTVFSETFKKIHNPTSDLKLESILEGLSDFAASFLGSIEAEIFVCPGINDSKREIEGLHSYLSELKNLEGVYLNAAVRAPIDSKIKTADQGFLNRFREELNLDVRVTTAFERSDVPKRSGHLHRAPVSADVLKLLLRHPCSDIQLKQVFGSNLTQINSLLAVLCDSGKIKKNSNNEWSLS